MDRRRFLERLALSGAAALLASPGRAAAAMSEHVAAPGGGSGAPPVLGITTHLLRPEDGARIRELGIRYVRTPGILQHWESGLWEVYMRELAERAQDQGFRLLWVLHNVPGEKYWREPARNAPGWMDRMTAFAEWTARLPATEAIQLWNEPDVWHQMPFGSAAGMSPERSGALYAEQLHRAYRRIKAANRRVQVVSAGTADHPSERWRGFLRGMLAESPPADAIAVHAYGPWPKARRIIREARELAGDRPLWLTEFGNDQDNDARFSPDRHFESITSTIEGNEREGLAERMYLYALQTDPRPQFSQHGLFAPDPRSEVAGRPRAAYEWIRRRRR